MPTNQAGRLSGLRRYMHSAFDSEAVKDMISNGLTNEQIREALGYPERFSRDVLPDSHSFSEALPSDEEEKAILAQQANQAASRPQQGEAKSNTSSEKAKEAKISKDRDAFIFAYETLMNTKIWKKATDHLEDDEKGSPDRLLGYREVSLDTKDGPNYHTVIKDPGDHVDGKVYAVNSEALDKLDDWESNYSRRLLTLKSGKKAYVYMLKDSAVDKKPKED